MSAIAQNLESVLVGGDLAKLTPDQRISYYKAVCDSVGLNPLTKPFDYLNLSGKTVLYAKRDATDQLRKIHGVSVKITARENITGVYVVTAEATDRDNRTDASTGAVNVEGLKGDNLANALMKAETKAKRRVTLSICGLGLLDETEIETIKDARVVDPDHPKQIAEGKPADGELVNSLEKTLRAAAGNHAGLEAAAKLIGQNKDKLTTAGQDYLRDVYREVKRWVAPPPVNEDAEPTDAELAVNGEVPY